MEVKCELGIELKYGEGEADQPPCPDSGEHLWLGEDIKTEHFEPDPADAKPDPEACEGLADVVDGCSRLPGQAAPVFRIEIIQDRPDDPDWEPFSSASETELSISQTTTKIANKKKPKGRKAKETKERTRRYKCTECPSAFYDWSTRKRHMLAHEGVRAFKCPDCPAAFVQKKHLNRHKTIHTGLKPFVCQVCSTAFRLKDQLDSHTRRQSCAKRHSRNKPVKKVVERHECPECPESFVAVSRFNLHVLRHSGGEKPFRCSECSAGFALKSHLDRHRRVHSGLRPFVCDTCNTAFKQKPHLVAHARLYSGVKTYGCSLCSAAFSERRYLKRHANTHTKKQQLFVCEICDEDFQVKVDLKSHEAVHKKQKKFECGICSASFDRLKFFRLHKKAHKRGREEVPKPRGHVLCATCGAMFSCPARLMDHEKSHSDERSFVCNVCGATFKHTKSLVRHVKLHNK